ncbi:aminotransferase class III-fold pyridoxal phosphate-dependent enzyme [Myxococcota bacterium]|nr:aminotransferase class III-fold pyridoxal phosphate-dependent enzyme [Myxococcota bacterium]MBU1536527.1 aminotransferase class III-fold pyridoxal phosphate-dependent enzyme [Myxococcota bacterium]
MKDKLNQTNSEALYNEALELIPGAILGIRRPYNFVPGEYPIFIDRGAGGRIWDVDGNEYIDLLCSYGPIILGHREKEIDDAVAAQTAKGFCFNLAQPLQNELAKAVRRLIPSAESSIFVKTGSDATTAAVRIARGYTDRKVILRCGYHGWHEWCVEVKGGIPEKLYEDVYPFKYNDVDSLAALVEKHRDDLAGIIVTPVGHPLAYPVVEPEPGFLEACRDLAHGAGAVVIFDEIRTGFRVSLGGAQARYGVTPDLSVFGKAMGNGYPISAVVGKKEVMAVVEGKVFISSTFFPNSLEMVAALKTIEILERENALDVLWERGTKLLADLGHVTQKAGFPVEITGIPVMPYVFFPKDDQGKYKARRTLFHTFAIRAGVFMQPYHHSYIAVRHTDEELAKVVQVFEDGLAYVGKVIP